MKIWTNTKTLDGYLDDYTFTEIKDEADVALIGSKTIDPDEFPKLKLIFRTGISKDNLPFEKAKARNIKVEIPSEYVQNYIYRETADFSCYLIMRMLYSNIGTVDPWHKEGRTALTNRNLLVMGLGKIGKMVVEKMKPFVNVLTFDIFQNKPKELNELISQADCISLHIPNTPENKSLFNKEKLSLMKDGAILVNTARGPIVDEDDLYTELKSKRIKAAFDVYWKEPYNGKLKEIDNDYFFMTPHVASTCNEFLAGAAEDFKNLVKEL